METYNLKFQSVEQLIKFVRWGEKVDGKMDISSGALNVDAKSIIGILNIGLNRDMTLSVYDHLSQKERLSLSDYISR
jgi:hypothetical protein